MKRPAKSTLVKAVLAAAVLAYLVYVIEPEEIARAAVSAEVGWLLAALALLPANLLLDGLGWHYLVRKSGREATPGQSFGSLLCGFALGLFTPARAGELAGRAFYLPHPDKWELGAMVFAQRMYDLVPAVCAGTVALLLYLLTASPTPAGLWWTIAAVGLGTSGSLVLLALLPRLAFRLLRVLLRSETARGRVSFLTRLSTRTSLVLLLVVFTRYLVYTVQFTLLVLAFAPGAPPLRIYLGIALTFFAKFLIPPVTLTDLGVREGAAVFFLGGMGLPEAAAFNASFSIYLINLLLPAALGLPFVFRMRLSRKAAPVPEEAALAAGPPRSPDPAPAPRP